MASGRLGVAAIPATTNTTVYTVPVATYTVCTVSVTNRNPTPVTIRVAMASTGTPEEHEWVEYGTSVIANGVFERTGLVMNAGLNLVVYSDTANVCSSVYGIETTTA
jgi:hypothetical protein